MSAKGYFLGGGINNYGAYLDWARAEGIPDPDGPQMYEKAFEQVHATKLAEIKKYMDPFLKFLNSDKNFQNHIWRQYWNWCQEKPTGIVPKKIKEQLEFNVTVMAYIPELNGG